MDFYGNAVIFELENQDTLLDGIYIPDVALHATALIGKVIKLGVGKSGHEFFVKVGDRIMFTKGENDLVDVNGKKYYMIDEEKILAIVG